MLMYTCIKIIFFLSNVYLYICLIPPVSWSFVYCLFVSHLNLHTANGDKPESVCHAQPWSIKLILILISCGPCLNYIVCIKDHLLWENLFYFSGKVFNIALLEFLMYFAGEKMIMNYSCCVVQSALWLPSSLWMFLESHREKLWIVCA